MQQYCSSESTTGIQRDTSLFPLHAGSEPSAADTDLKRVMRILETEPTQLDTAQLHELIGSLRYSQKDFETRLAGQVAALERLDAMHANNPVYQALFFLLRNITERLSRAESELSRRTRSASA